MNLQTLIRDIADQTEDETVQFRADYSGRGMYGRSCVGITGQWGHCMSTIADVADQLHQTQPQEFAGLIRTLLDFRFDGMGYDTIVYWPELGSQDLEPYQGIRGHYDGRCPECNLAMPVHAKENSSCTQCGFVFVADPDQDPV